jgi:negative regulator of replication initiation
MRMRQVEVDDEVFSFVKAHAEPLIDTFNSSLRRLLPLGGQDGQMRAVPDTNAIRANADSLIPTLPTGIPEALRQILEVIRLVCGGAYTRTAATQFVAKQHGVFPQTVLDKYCRQLQLTANQFDRLLEQEGLARLREILRSKFPAHTEIIDDLLEFADSNV